MDSLSIDGRTIGHDQPTYIIAEIGANHNGDLDLCKRLIDSAKSCGVDAVKFQSWSKTSLISRAEYVRNARYSQKDPSTLTLEQEIEKNQLTPEMHAAVAEYCRRTGVTFFSSCFSPQEVDLLVDLGTPAFKIASMDVNHLPLLEYVASKGKPVILSTGLATLGEIERAVGILRQGAPLALLHCVSIYPSPPEIVDLANMKSLRQVFDLPTGYSDHCLGTSIALASVALGACIIEKHFTLDKNMPGWDHGVSADPTEMAYLVQEARAVRAALGSPVRRIHAAQADKQKVFRRRIVLKRAVPKGSRVEMADLDFQRPGTGIAPDQFQYVVGRSAAHDLDADRELEWTDLV